MHTHTQSSDQTHIRIEREARIRTQAQTLARKLHTQMQMRTASVVVGARGGPPALRKDPSAPPPPHRVTQAQCRAERARGGGAAFELAKLEERTIEQKYKNRITSHHGAHITSKPTAHNVISVHIASHYIASHRTKSHHIASLHITSHHITPHQITSNHITSHRITSRHITSHRITSRHTTSHHIKSHQITYRARGAAHPDRALPVPARVSPRPRTGAVIRRDRRRTAGACCARRAGRARG